jgi:O-antigen ligase
MSRVREQFSEHSKQQAAVVETRAESVTSGHRGRADAVRLLSFYLILLMLIPADLVFAPLGAAGSPATLFALLLFVIFLGAWLHPTHIVHRGRQPIRTVAVLFACAIIASYTSANRHALPVLELNAADRGLIFTFGWLGITLLAADGISSMARLRTLIRRLVLGATAMAVLGIMQFFTGLDATKYIKIPGLTALTIASDLLSRGSFNRPSATASHPLEFGTVLVIALPLAIHQARFAQPDERRRRWLQVAVIGLAAPMTVSRSAILGLIIVGIVTLPTWPKRDRRIAYVAVLLASVMMWLSVHGLVGTIKELFLSIGSDSSTQSRSNAFTAAGMYVSHNPWLGRGLGTFLPQTYFYIDDQYLTSLIETGIIGGLALLAVFVAAWATARSGRRIATDLEDRDLGQCFAASIAAAAVSFSTYDALSFSMASGLTFLLVGCCGAYRRIQRDANAPIILDRRAVQSNRKAALHA